MSTLSSAHPPARKAAPAAANRLFAGRYRHDALGFLDVGGSPEVYRASRSRQTGSVALHSCHCSGKT
jgi:hypothetical protein